MECGIGGVARAGREVDGDDDGFHGIVVLAKLQQSGVVLYDVGLAGG